MSLLVGCMCNEPEHTGQALAAVKDVLVAPAAPLGWGLACYQGADVLLSRHPKPRPTEVDLHRPISDLRTDYIVAQVREGAGEARVEDTPPFRFRSWVFAHAGELPGFDRLRPKLIEGVPDFLRRSVRGATQEEVLLHVLLAFLHDAGKLDDPQLGISELAWGLRATAALLDRHARELGAEPGVLNCVVTNGRVMAAMRRGSPMYLWRKRGLELAPASPGQRPVRRDDLRAALIVSSPATPPRLAEDSGWDEVPEGSIVLVSRDVTASIAPLAA